MLTHYSLIYSTQNGDDASQNFTSILFPTASCGSVFYSVTFPLRPSFALIHLGSPQQSFRFNT